MSQRHRADETPVPPRREIRAHAHGERHRIQVQLHRVAHQVSAGVEPEDLHEPGVAWRPVHHHSAERALRKLKRSRTGRHWKTKMWKRRSARRRERAQAFRLAAEG